MPEPSRQSIVFMKGAEPEPSFHGSTSAEIHRWTAKFLDPSVEAEYRREEVDASLRPFLRFSVLVVSLAFLAYGVHDAVVVPATRALAWLVRYGIFVPVAAITFAVVQSRHLARWHQPVMLLFGLSTTTVVLLIGATSTREGFFIYTSFAILFVTLGSFIGRMTVATQLVYTAITLATYDALDFGISHSSTIVRLSMNLTFFSMGLIGALTAHQMETMARRAYLQRKTIRDQLQEIESERERSESLLLNILPAPIARRLKKESRAIAEGFTEATILFADIVGFTKMSARLQPEEVVRRLNQIFSAFDDMADELGLEKIKTIGDAYMVAGGLHGRHTRDHAQAVAEMALRMLAHMKTYSEKIGEPLSIRIGIHTGPVVAGVIGKRKFIYDVWGDTVNTASRMESHGLPSAIQVSTETHDKLGNAYDFEDRGEIDVKGKGSMRAWLLRGPVTRELS